MKPTHYNLYLHPDLKTGNFSGQVIISVTVLQETNQIILHANKLDITNVYVIGNEVASYYLDEIREFLVITMTNTLTANANIRLGILFEGQMLNKIVGLYSSTYTTPNDDKR